MCCKVFILFLLSSMSPFALNVDFFLFLFHFLIKYGLFIKVTHNWETMRTAVNNYIGSLNWGYRVSLRDKNVNYVNGYAEFVEPHKIKVSVFRSS